MSKSLREIVEERRQREREAVREQTPEAWPEDKEPTYETWDDLPAEPEEED